MPSLNFLNKFALDVELENKKQTIRKMRKKPFKLKDHLYLYTGMRTKGCRKLGEAIASEVSEITICPHRILVDGKELGKEEKEHLAYCDGFDSIHHFNYFFLHDYPGGEFKGQIIKWDSLIQQQ